MKLCLGFAVVTDFLVDGTALHIAVRTNPRVPGPLYAAVKVLEGPFCVSHRTARLAPALVAVCESGLDLDRSREVVDSTCKAVFESQYGATYDSHATPSAVRTSVYVARMLNIRIPTVRCSVPCSWAFFAIIARAVPRARYAPRRSAGANLLSGSASSASRRCFALDRLPTLICSTAHVTASWFGISNALCHVQRGGQRNMSNSERLFDAQTAYARGCNRCKCLSAMRLFTCNAGGSGAICSLVDLPTEPFALGCLGVPAGLVVFPLADVAFAAWAQVPSRSLPTEVGSNDAIVLELLA